jgi:hypothetical protein
MLFAADTCSVDRTFFNPLSNDMYMVNRQGLPGPRRHPVGFIVFGNLDINLTPGKFSRGDSLHYAGIGSEVESLLPAAGIMASSTGTIGEKNRQYITIETEGMSSILRFGMISRCRVRAARSKEEKSQ